MFLPFFNIKSISMDTSAVIENNDYLYGGDFLEELTKEYQWSSLLDAADATPSEILADAAPILVPPISPILSVISCPTESSNSDSGSEDDSKNSSSTSARQSSQSPLDLMFTLEDEPSNDLKPEDVELFLQKTSPISTPPLPEFQNSNPFSITPPEKKGPVMSIENGIIKGVKIDNDISHQHKPTVELPNHAKQDGIGHCHNSFFKVVNENFSANNIKKEENHIVLNDQIKLVVEQKKVPAILKRSTNILVKKPPSLVIPAESTKGGKIAISPLPQNKYNGNQQTNGYHIEISQPQNIILSQNPIITSVQSIKTPVLDVDLSPSSPPNDLSHLSDVEIKAIKKQQRMIKNRESACQSRQKKKEYVSTLEHQLLEAHQEIARLQLENKILRDQLDNNCRGRKIPKLDASLLIPKKNIAVFFAMVFLVSMNWNVLGWNSRSFVGPSVPHQSTRHLLWSEDSDNSVNQDTDQLDNSTYNVDCQNSSTKQDFLNMNHTESIRIVGELNRWIGGGKTLNWTYDTPRKKRRVYLNEEKIDGGFLETYKLFNKLNVDNNLIDFINTRNQGRNVREKSRHRRLRRHRELDFDDNAVIDYESLYQKRGRKPAHFSVNDLGEWNDLLQALHRRDDTFYVVGVGKGEHLLLPAVSHNVTRPPRMALILPAKSSNDSLMTDHVTLMQIDCSVVNTTIVKLKSEALPESLRKKVGDDPKTSNNESTSRKNKHNNRRTDKHSNGANLSDGLHNSSNISNYPIKFKKEIGLTANEVPKDDTFTQYLFSKIDVSKPDISDPKKYVKRKMENAALPVNVQEINSIK